MQNEQETITQKTKEVLTTREKELLQLAAFGLSNKEMADQLKLSMDTIDTHHRNITKKLQAKNIKEAIAKGLRSGLIQ